MIRVLCYHGIISEKVDQRLERNLHTVQSFRKHLSLLQVFRSVKSTDLETPKADISFLITFDDGYKNNLVAAELLARYKIPWILFISTGAVGRENAIWTVELSLLFLHGEAKSLEVMDQHWTLTTRTEREAAFQSVRFPMKGMPAETRIKVMQQIRSQFPPGETQRLLEKFPSLQMLTWAEVKQLANAGVEIGSHGVNHELHHEAQPAGVRLAELSSSKKEIEEKIQVPCRSFAYPNGNYIASSPSEVKSMGYERAYTLGEGAMNGHSEPYLLPRMQPPEAFHKFLKTCFWNEQKSN